MQKLIFFLILGFLAFNASSYAQSGPRRNTGSPTETTRPVSNRTTTRQSGPSRPSPGTHERKTTLPSSAPQRPQTRPTLPPVITWPEVPSQRRENPEDRRWSGRDEDRDWGDSDRHDRDQCHCKGNGHGKGKGHDKKKGKGHWKHHGCD